VALLALQQDTSAAREALGPSLRREAETLPTLPHGSRGFGPVGMWPEDSALCEATKIIAELRAKSKALDESAHALAASCDAAKAAFASPPPPPPQQQQQQQEQQQRKRKRQSAVAGAVEKEVAGAEAEAEAEADGEAEAEGAGAAAGAAAAEGAGAGAGVGAEAEGEGEVAAEDAGGGGARRRHFRAPTPCANGCGKPAREVRVGFGPVCSISRCPSMRW
jgi:hypothetical protein